MVPFSLRHLYAEIYYSLGRDPTMDYLHTLRLYCQNKIKEIQQQPAKTATETDESAAINPVAITEAQVDALQSPERDPLLAISPTANPNLLFRDEYDEGSSKLY